MIRWIRGQGLNSQIMVMIDRMMLAQGFLRSSAASVIMKPFTLPQYRMEIERLLLYLMDSDDSESMSLQDASISHSAFSSEESDSGDEEGGLDFLKQ